MSFGGISSSSVTFVNNTTLHVQIPIHAAGQVDVTEMNPDGQTTKLAAGFTYNPAPSISNISPTGGSTQGGTLVTINGSNFVNPPSVAFGPNNAAWVSYISPTKLQASTPANANEGFVGVFVTNPDNQTAALPSSYTYSLPPNISGISPNGGPPAGGTTVTVSGHFFRLGATVSFGGVSAPSVAFINNTTLHVQIPAHAAGPVDVTEMNPDGQTTTLGSGFTYNAAPSISSISPTGGSTLGGTLVTINGSNFVNPPSVAFGPNNATSLTFISSTKLQAVTPANPTEGAVGVFVTNPDGQAASLPTSYTYALAPMISGVSPNNGPPSGGITVAITGSAFRTGATVMFGGVSSTSVIFDNNTQLRAVTPVHASGIVDVTVVNPDGQVATLSASYTYNPAISITSISPAAGPTSGNAKVNIQGVYFITGAKVTFGGTLATSVTYLTGNQLLATTPAHSKGIVDVTVTNPSGQSATLPASYTFTPGPVVYSILPNSGPTIGGTAVLISGANLKAVTQVLFGSSPAKILSASAGQLRVTTPPGAGGPVSVVVKNPTGSFTVAGGFAYTIVIDTNGLDDAYPGIPFRQKLSASAGKAPYTWSVTSGPLPTGLGLDPSTGVLSGTPGLPYGIFNITFQATDSSSQALSVTKTLTLNLLFGFQPGPIPDDFFGMILYSQNNWPLVPIGALGKGLATTWPFIEQAKGQFNWSVLDQYVQDSQTHNVSIYWSNANTPPWAVADTSTCSFFQNTNIQACTGMITNIQDWDDFITALVTRYKGKIQIYELWNEPNVTNTFSGTVTDMVTLTQSAYNIIRSIDPAALTASPSSTAVAYLQNYWNAGGTTGFDIYAIHGYPNVGQNDVPEAIVGFKGVNAKSIMLQFGFENKPLWDTESSWGGPNANKDPDFRAAFIARSFLLHWAAGIPRFYWYGWDSPVWGTLFDPVTGITKAATAYQQVHDWMLGATMPTPCSRNGGTVFSAVYTCDLTRTGGYQARAVWDTNQTCANGVCTTSSYTPDPMFVQYRDVDGNVTPITPGQPIQVGAKPILLEN